MKLCSVWKDQPKNHEKLRGEIERDVVVVGGGIAGYLTAFRLAESGACVTLLEADRLFSGTTGRTTAKITCNQGNVYSDLRRRYGVGMTALYYNAQLSGMRGYRDLVRKYGISCDFTETDSYIFSRTGRKRLEKTCEILRGLGADCEITQSAPPIDGIALKMGGQYLFDPLKFLRALPVKFEIYERTRAVDIDPSRKLIRTEDGEVRAKTLIIATHYPIINSHGLYFMKLRQSTSYTIALGGVSLNAMYLDERDEGLSLRPYAGGVLLGGGDHRTGRIKTANAFRRLEQQAAELFGESQVTHRWNAEDVMTFDGVPMAGRYAKRLDGVYVITGFNKWGMTNAMTCAGVIRDLILGRENPYADLYDLQRHIKKSAGDFLKNAAVNAAGITLGYLRLTARTAAALPKGQGGVVWYRGKRRAVYRDEDGKLYAIGRMCPHMHCELKWNGNTRTWDCPCHGSVLDIRGNILAEPTTKAAKCETSDERRPPA